MALLFRSLGKFLHFLKESGAVPALECGTLGGEFSILGGRPLDAAHAGAEGFATLGSLAPWLQLGGFLSDGTLQVGSVLAIVFFAKGIIEPTGAGMALGVVSQKRLFKFLHALFPSGQLSGILEPFFDAECFLSTFGAIDRSIDDFTDARTKGKMARWRLLSK